ncbi:MAG: N-acetyltransferase [Chloroflexi bacterium]|nr:MAG: N-acetyltransferase [Chloroflexota bacterium]
MPTLTIYPQHNFPTLYKSQALAFMRCEWSSIFQGDNLYMSETYPPELHPVHFVITEGETLLSYATLLRHGLTHASHDFDIYGFGNMFTFPPFRKQGYGSQILRSATEFIQRGEADAAILYCDASLEAYYAAEGWITTHSETRLGQPEKYTVYDPIRMMLFVSAKGLASQAEFERFPVYIDWPW